MKKILVGLFTLWVCAAQAQIVGTLPFQLQNGTTADATQVMADFNKILNDVNTNGAKNGVNTDITALNALVTPITPAQGGSTVYFASTSGGTANAQTVAAPAPVGFTLSVGKRITFIAGFTNTGAMQLNVNGTGLTNVFRMTPAGPVALIGGEVVANNYIEAVFDGTQYQLYTDATQKGGFGALANLASATTTDLGTIPSHNVQITGTTTITSFGSSAITSYPIYQIRFTGAVTLTNSGALALPGSANILTAANDSAVVQYVGSGNWTVTGYTRANGTAIAGAAPTVQRITSASSGTYTTPASVRWIRIRLVGGGAGGGQGGNAGTGAAGTASTFSGGTLSAGGGVAGSGSSTGGSGGTASNGNIISVNGGSGGGSTATAGVGGGTGGNSCLGGGGAGAAGGNNAGGNAAPNTGGGGGGGSITGGGSGAASGGGSGACIEHVINAPAASYSYTVGAGGAGGSGGGAGGGVGGAGTAGLLVVEEYY